MCNQFSHNPVPLLLVVISDRIHLIDQSIQQSDHFIIFHPDRLRGIEIVPQELVSILFFLHMLVHVNQIAVDHSFVHIDIIGIGFEHLYHFGGKQRRQTDIQITGQYRFDIVE